MSRLYSICLVAIASCVFSADANAQRSAADIIQGHISGIASQLQGGQVQGGQFQGSQFQGGGQQHFNGNKWGGNWNQVWPGHCGNPGWIAPPPPPPTYIYKVYYFCQHNGWAYYGSYHSEWPARQAVNSLQHQGYRAYMQKVQKNGFPQAGAQFGN